MSTPEHFFGVQAERPAERALFRALLDDAAVFPPALVPLPQAITDHLARQSNSYADLVGPLLLPASAVEDFLHLERRQRLDVAMIARAGTDLALVGDALQRLEGDPAVTVSGVEIGWSSDWHQALGWGAPLSVEVPRGSEQRRALSDIQESAGGPSPVRAKFRTGSTPDSSIPIPTPTELATFLRACVDHDLAFKLTGGLHHAISQSTTSQTPTSQTTASQTTTSQTTTSHSNTGVEDQFGFLNVIAATRWALSHGAEVPQMEPLLTQRDPEPILDIITRMSEADASVVRAFLTAYGCCAVMDPIGDLAALGLIKERAL